MSLRANIRRYSFNSSLTGILFGVFSVVGIVRALQHYYIVDAYEPVQFGLWWHIPFNVVMWWTWLVFIPLIYWLAVRLNNVKPRILYWSVLCVLLPLFIVFLREVIASFLITQILVTYSTFRTLLFKRIFTNIWVWVDLIVYFTVLVGIQIIEYQETTKIDERKLVQLKTQLTQSRLSALESLLHPHFLFNTLNTLSTLILKSDTNEAERMLNLLQEFLKTTIYDTGRHEIPLKEELLCILRYLEIEKVRFKGKLEVRQDIADDTLPANIPSLLLQPIIENAIYHGIAAKTSNGVLSISSRRENGSLEIRIEDNGPGLSENKGKKGRGGIGLKSTKERLSRLFGEDHVFAMENIPSGGLCVKIRIPFTLYKSTFSPETSV
jgi:sensor histidine kinase YesM